MNGDSSTAPTRPPPLPGVGPPLLGVLGPVGSSQQELASPSDSSKVTISRPSAPKAGEATMRGTQRARKALAAAMPPVPPSAQDASWPSLHRSGVMNDSAGVVAAEARSPGRR